MASQTIKVSVGTIFIVWLCAMQVYPSSSSSEGTTGLDAYPDEIFLFADQQVRKIFNEESELSYTVLPNGHFLFEY